MSLQPSLCFFGYEGPNDEGQPAPERDILSINKAPQFETPGCILIGLRRVGGDYQNIQLDAATALAFADAIREHFQAQFAPKAGA